MPLSPVAGFWPATCRGLLKFSAANTCGGLLSAGALLQHAEPLSRSAASPALRFSLPFRLWKDSACRLSTPRDASQHSAISMFFMFVTHQQTKKYRDRPMTGCHSVVLV